MNVILSMEEPSVIAFENVFEDGDRWDKIKGCETCKNKKKCCGTCPHVMENGDCQLHIEENGKRKSYRCISRPHLKDNFSWCVQEYECTAGSRKGEIRKISEPLKNSV